MLEVISVKDESESYHYVLMILKKTYELNIEYYEDAPDIRLSLLNGLLSEDFEEEGILAWAYCEKIFKTWMMIDNFATRSEDIRHLQAYIANTMNKR